MKFNTLEQNFTQLISAWHLTSIFLILSQGKDWYYSSISSPVKY